MAIPDLDRRKKKAINQVGGLSKGFDDEMEDEKELEERKDEEE